MNFSDCIYDVSLMALKYSLFKILMPICISLLHHSQREVRSERSIQPGNPDRIVSWRSVACSEEIVVSSSCSLLPLLLSLVAEHRYRGSVAIDAVCIPFPHLLFSFLLLPSLPTPPGCIAASFTAFCIPHLVFCFFSSSLIFFSKSLASQ